MIQKYSQLYLAGATQQQIDATVKKLGLSQDELLAVVNEADPTKENKFEAWIMKQMFAEVIELPQDKEKIFSLLQDFIIFSNKKKLQKRDINQYRVDELEEEIASIKDPNLQDAFSSEVNELLKLPGVEVLSQNKDYLVLKVWGIDSVVKLGDSTQWCTRHPEQAEKYLIDRGYNFLYVVFAKEKGKLIKLAQITPDFKEMQNIDNKSFSPDNSLYSVFKETVLQEEKDVTKKIDIHIRFMDAPGLEEYFREIETMPGDEDKAFYGRVLYNGNLILNGSPVSFLPKNLYVNGILDISYTDIVEIPKTLFCMGLKAVNCTQLIQLPDFKENPKQSYGVCEDNLNIVSCVSLEQLPEKLMLIKKNLNASSCVRLKKLPDILNVIERSCILNNSGIESLPNPFVCGGDLEVSGTPIKTIPREGSVESFYAENCFNLKILPSDSTLLKKTEEISFAGCNNLIKLPDKITTQYLNLKETQVALLPESLYLIPVDEDRLVIANKGIVGTNLHTGKTYEDEYDAMQNKMESTATLRKLRVIE